MRLRIIVTYFLKSTRLFSMLHFFGSYIFLRILIDVSSFFYAPLMHSLESPVGLRCFYGKISEITGTCVGCGQKREAGCFPCWFYKARSLRDLVFRNVLPEGVGCAVLSPC